MLLCLSQAYHKGLFCTMFQEDFMTEEEVVLKKDVELETA